VGFKLNGFVLRPARVASGNAQDSNEAVTGVDRDHILSNNRMVSPPAGEITLESLGYQVRPEVRPDGTDVLVEPYADMYRAAVLERAVSKQSTEQYCLFAATTGSLSTVEDTAMAIVGAASTAVPIPGTLAVTNPSPPPSGWLDGTNEFYVRDAGQRDIASVISITILVGPSLFPVTYSVTNDDPSTGRVTLLGSLGGGVYSVERGDQILSTAYILASPSFWWTRNDDDMTRFGWDGKSSRWLPLKGGAAQNMGTVLPDTGYKLTPPPTRFQINDTLPGSSVFPDAYALVRLGLYADKDSTPLNILVVSDTAASGTWQSPTWDAYDAVVGVTNGVLLLSPTFVTTDAGRTLWYNAETFQSDADGDLGALAVLPTGSNQGFPSLSPVPGPTERPFLRIGSRRYLTPVPVDTDADLNAPSGVPTGSFEWSKATGKVVLSDIDIAKCIPGSATVDGDPADYEIPFLGARLYYDGVALSTQPLPLKAAVPGLNPDGYSLDGSDPVADHTLSSSGSVWVPRAVCMPPPGISGVRWEPDDTGDTPVVPGPSLLAVNQEPQTRPNGTGLVRRITGGAGTRLYGDSFFFTTDYAYENTDVVEYDEDLKTLKFKVPKNGVEISRMTVSASQPTNWDNTSRIQLRRRPVKGQPLYFRQAEVVPSVYADEAKVYSRLAEPYSVAGTETLRFAIDGAVFTWSGSSLNATGVAANYTAQEVADSLNTLSAGIAGVLRGRIYLRAADLAAGIVEIGWNVDPGDGSTDYTDLSGHAMLGLLPGWRVDTNGTTFRWLPDNGAFMGLFRSAVNMDMSDSTPDIRAVGRVNDSLLLASVNAYPFVAVSPPPLVDLPGYTATSHFEAVIGLLTIELENYQTTLDVGVVYDWVNDRFTWCSDGRTGGTQIPYPTSALQLANVGVFPETVSPLAMDDAAYGLNLRRATDAAGQTLPADFAVPEDLTGSDTTIDFLMPGNGGPGQAVLVTPEGAEAATGGKGETTAGSGVFFDANVSDQSDLAAAVEPGYLLHILTGDNEGIYTVIGVVTGSPTLITVTPDFAATDLTTQWRIYEAKPRSAVDLTLLADVQQVATSHFPENPFKVRTLTSVGQVGASLVANVADALASTRTVSLRFGLGPIAANERTVSYLVQGTNLGPVVAAGLVCPDPADPHLTLSGGAAAYFQIRVGAKVYSLGAGNLTLDTGTPAVDGIDVSTTGATTGEILIGAGVIADLTGSAVYYDQTFLDPTDVPSGTCEIAPLDGSVNINSTDAGAYVNDIAYFVEQMVTDNDRDAKINPMNGSLLFSKPLRALQIVEVNYFQADTNGDKKLDKDGNPVEITEFLPLMVSLETCAYVSNTEWAYNPTGRTLSATVEPMMWVGTNLMNYAGVKNATADKGVLSITDETAALLKTSAATVVRINYGVLEAFGGETAYTVSKPPVFCKPFWIEADSSTFTLETDRTADFVRGLLMVLGPTPLYIESSTYSATTDLTTVTIFPTPENEVGSRAPGRDAGLTLSDFLVSVSRGGGAGFMPVLDTSVTPLLECDKGQVAVAFYGDVRRYMNTDHLLEIGGYPYLIVNSELSSDGYNTLVQVASPLAKQHDNSEEVRVSVRRLYLNPPVEFTGISPFIPSEEYDLFLMGITDSAGALLPGKALVEGFDYTIDPTTGEVAFQAPTQGALQPGEYLHLRYTRLVSVGPTVVEGAIVYPVYRAKYLYTATPSVENRLLGAALKGEYTYRSQDSFFYSVEALEEYLGEVSVASASQGIIPFSGGPVFFSDPGSDPSKQGGYGLRGGVVDAQDQDRAARVFVEFFNGVTLAFEQVLEAIDGRIIGDRDGKFRFFIGHDKRYAPPGYEDEITGNLNQRLLWRDLIDAWAPSAFEDDDGYYRTKDYLYLPTTATVEEPRVRPGETSGTAMDPSSLSAFTDRQRRLIKNDMDDRILKGSGRSKTEFKVSTMFSLVRVKGDFDDMWEDHRFSRLFPTETEHFSRLFPGINYDPAAQDPGFFTPGRDIEMPGPEPGETSIQTVKTFGQPNGAISNNALGDIPNIIDVSVKDRLPRGRVWAYYPNGSSALETALGLTAGATTGKATLVLTVLTMDQFPIDPATGFPDIDPTTGLILPPVVPGNPGTGVVYSLVTGNPDIATPAFEVGQRVNYGKPDGTVYSLSDSLGNGIFIEQVLAGCVVTLATSDGATTPAFTSVAGSNVYTDKDTLTNLDGVISPDNGYSDTMYVGTGVGVDPIGDPPTTAELTLLAESMPEYRQFFDVGLQRKSGDIIDITFPGPDDNFFLNLRAIFGQNPPDPLSCVEGTVKFINTASEPLQLPCLLGEDKDDSGDQQIPFLRGTPNELTVLREVQPLLEDLYVDTTLTLPYAPVYYDDALGLGTVAVVEQQNFSAVYPNETLVGDGALYESATYIGYPQNPATLYTARDLNAAAVSPTGSPATGTGLGDLRRFDLLFSQVNQTAVDPAWLGMTGILDVGDVVYDASGSGTRASIEIPRFVSPCEKGQIHNYTLLGWAAYVSERDINPGEGFEVSVALNPAPNQFTSTLLFNSVTDMPDLSLLTPLLVNNNAFVIRIYDPDALAAEAFIGAITLISGSGAAVKHYFYNHAAGTITTPSVLVAPTYGPTGILIQYDMALTPTPTDPLETVLGLVPGQRYDFRLDIDTYGALPTTNVSSAALAGALYGSDSCAVLRDRLTFTEELDLTMAKPRDYLPANDDAYEMGASLDVAEFTANGVSGLTANRRQEINGGSPLSFLNRYNTTPQFYVGTYDGTDGRLRAMSWEGHGNLPLPAEITDLLLSSAPSSDGDTGGEILEGTFQFWDGGSSLTPVATGVGAYEREGNRNYLSTVTETLGAGGNVLAGDICVVTQNPSENGAVKTGSYLVRHAVPFGTDICEAASSNFGNARLLAARQGPDAADPFPAAQAPSKQPRVDLGTGVASVPPAGQGCLDLTSPTIQAVTVLGTRITLANVVPVTGSATGCGWENPATVGPYRLYLVLKDQYATYSDDAGGPGVPGWVVDADAVWSVEVTSITTGYDAEAQTITFQANTTTLSRANPAAPLTWATFQAGAVSGTRVSGMTALPLKQMGSHLPTNNLVGADYLDDGGAQPLLAGFRRMYLGNRNGNMIQPYFDAGYADSFTALWLAGVNLSHRLGAVVPTAGDIVTNVLQPADNTDFYVDRGQPVYGRIYDPAGPSTKPIAGVVSSLSLHDWPRSQWQLLHFGSLPGIRIYNSSQVDITGTQVMECLLPQDRFTFGSNIDPTVGDPGYYALSGVFLEPSFPRPVTNINSTAAKVTSATYDSLTVDQIGARDYAAFGGATDYETVTAAIRRIRRFHKIQVDIIDLIRPLRYVYEIRRGFVGSYVAGTRTLVATTPAVYDGYATNLGAFNNRDVNIHQGDVVRVLNAAEEVVDTAEIQRVEDATTLILRRPGLTNAAFLAAPGDFTFEVYLEQAVVPHEQSNEQLLDLLTQETVFTRRVDYIDPTPGAEIGGEVTVANEMMDTGVTDWEAVGVQAGDYVVIDPAGDLYKEQESGARPSGDMSVVGRSALVPSPYVQGGPSRLDDNRGFYKVEEVGQDSGGAAPGTLTLSGSSRFTDGAIFGSATGVVTTDSQYVVMPTIHGSQLTGDGIEDQQALRPTAPPVGNSYYARTTGTTGDDGYKSITPFAYQIIRPNPIFSKDTVELILFTRERMLSWIDEITTLWSKSGDYYVFQRDDQIEDVGSDTDASAGAGVLSNLVADSLRGLTDTTPFANMSDCLSVLDRRFWILDLTLDFQPTGGAATYTQFSTGDYAQRPVEPDLIDGVLNTDDLFRSQRYGWITFRANRTDGSIRKATRETRTLASRLQKQREALMRQKGLDKA
jgi:hypothetical protein